MKLDWQESFDDDNNSIWEAASPYHDDGNHFKFRLVQTIVDNKIRWIECHDSEIAHHDVHETLDDAKMACQLQADEMVGELSV